MSCEGINHQILAEKRLSLANFQQISDSMNDSKRKELTVLQ
jgi:hypothetical protein